MPPALKCQVKNERSSSVPRWVRWVAHWLPVVAVQRKRVHDRIDVTLVQGRVVATDEITRSVPSGLRIGVGRAGVRPPAAGCNRCGRRRKARVDSAKPRWPRRRPAVTGEVCEQFHDGAPRRPMSKQRSRCAHGGWRAMRCSSTKCAQPAVTADRSGPRVVDDHLTGPCCSRSCVVPSFSAVCIAPPDRRGPPPGFPGVPAPRQ